MVPHVMPLSVFLHSISTYDIDPKVAKAASVAAGMADLEKDAGNLAIVLRNILANDSSRDQLLALLKDMLPFIEDVDVDRLPDASFLIRLRESYTKGHPLPSPFASDGTINLLSILIALLFQESDVVIIEEPERSVHPELISGLVALMKETTERFGKQIIITTHLSLIHI